MAPFFGFRGRRLDAALIWAVIMPAYLLFGYNNGVTSVILALPSFENRFPSIDTEMAYGSEKRSRSDLQGTVVALYALGALFGALSCLLIGDILGRRKTIMLGALIDIIGAALQASSFSLGQLIVGRLVTGIGFGALSATAPNWQSETSQAAHRGAAVMFESLFISGGLALVAWIETGLSYSSSEASWRFPFAFGAFLAALVIIMIPQMPESPRWLVRKGRVDEAKSVISALSDVPMDAPEVSEQIAEIRESLRISGKGSFRDLFRNGPQRLFNRTCIAVSSQMFQQFCGINALAFYQAIIFENYIEVSPAVARILSASVFSFQTLVSPIGILTIDNVGRRKLMIFGALGMGSCMAIVAGTTSQASNKAAASAAGGFVFLFSFFFSIGFLGITFLYASEIAPLNVRTEMTSLSTGATWLSNFLVAELTPVGFDNIGYRYFIIYACINLFLIFPSVYLFFPETKGRHLEQIDHIFIDSENILAPVRIAKKVPEMRHVEEAAAAAAQEEAY